MNPNRHPLVLALLASTLSWACDESSVSMPTEQREAELRDLRGTVTVQRGSETLPAAPGTKLGPDDVLVVGKSSIALFECSHGVAGKLGPAASAAVKSFACFEAQATGTYEAQLEHLLAPGDRTLLAGGERVAAIDARLRAASGGSSSSQEAAVDEQLDSAGGAAEGKGARDENAAEEEAPSVVAAKPDTPAKTKPKRPAAEPVTERPRDNARNLARLQDQEGDGLRASSSSIPPPPPPGAVGSVPAAKKLRPLEIASGESADGVAGLVAKPAVPSSDASRPGRVKGRPMLRPAAAPSLPSIVYANKALRQCALGMLKKGESELRLVITVRDGTIVDVKPASGKAKVDACLMDGLKRESAKGIPDGRQTVVLARKLLEKA